MTSTERGNHRWTLVEAAVASTIGTTIEWYDFFLVTGVAKTASAEPWR